MSPYSILIVDDEANQRLMLEQALRSLAYNWIIATAASGKDALEALNACPPDLIITDYHMPFMNGLDLIARVRELQLLSRIILITAYSSPELYEAAQRLHIDHCLTKPVPLTLLRRITTSVLETAPLQLDQNENDRSLLL
jgi:YesN/AraC family two-component response regulator